MWKFIAVGTLLLILAVSKVCRTAQINDIYSCPAKVNVEEIDILVATKRVCNIQFEAPINQSAYFVVLQYQIQPERFILLFDGTSCVSDMVKVIEKSRVHYKSTGRQLTVLYGSSIFEPDVEKFVNLGYYNGTTPKEEASRFPQFMKRTCGSKLMDDSTTLSPTLSQENLNAGICVWQVETKSNKPVNISVTKFQNSGINQLLIFDGTDCSGQNLLWLSAANASNTEAMSKTGKFIILSVTNTSTTPFELTYTTDGETPSTGVTTSTVATANTTGVTTSTGTPQGSTGAPQGSKGAPQGSRVGSTRSTDDAHCIRSVALPFIVLLCGLREYI